MCGIIAAMSRTDFIHPDDMFMYDGTVFIRPPYYLVCIAQTKSPAHLYWYLKDTYPSIMTYLTHGFDIPLSCIEHDQPWTFENELEAIDDRGW